RPSASGAPAERSAREGRSAPPPKPPSRPPGSARHWSPTRVLVDGQPAQGLWRAPDGILWLEAAAGTHQVLLEGPLPDVDRVEMPLPLKPRRVEAHAEGWTVEGLREDGLAADNLE